MTETLRTGFTTGACAAAAAKAAALCLRGEECRAVELTFPAGDTDLLAINRVERLSATSARATVIKDAGDDPDITDGMAVVTTIELLGSAITFHAGEGVGTVTGPGLQLPLGEPAINPVPREMITLALREALGDVGCRVTVSIPGGEEAAAKTFNPRLGITGGLSILGTSGRVMPKSEDAWLRSLIPQIDVALAAGHTRLFLTPGGFGEKAATEHYGAEVSAVVQTSNFIGEMLRACTERGVPEVVLIGHIGKMVKVAAGIFNTHSRFGDARLETLAALAAAEGAPPTLVNAVLALPTCEAAVSVLAAAGLSAAWDAVAERAARRAKEYAGLPVHCALVAYSGEIVGCSTNLRRDDAPTAGEYWLLGVGPGPADWLTPKAWQVLKRAQVVAGGKRQLEQFTPAGVEQIVVGADMPALVEQLRACRGKRIVVLASGDPGCYGLLATLRREMGNVVWHVIPGISSMQLALARLSESWDGVVFTSAHGRDLRDVVEAVRTHARVLALTDPKQPAQALAAALVTTGLERALVVLEKLGYPDERITRGSTVEIASGTFDPLAVVWIEVK